MQDSFYLSFVLYVFLYDSVEVFRFVYPCPGTDKPGLDKMPEQNFQGLSVTLEHSEHKEGQHDDDHEYCRHADPDRFLGQKE